MSLSPLALSLLISISAGLISFVISCFCAWLLYEKRGMLRNVFDIVLCLPLVLPPTATGLFLLVVLGRESAVGSFFESLGIQIVFTPAAAVLAAVMVSLPLMYRGIAAAFMQVDKNVISSARTLGFSEGKILFKLLLPLARHGIAAAAALGTARAMGEFGASLMAAGNIPGKTRTMPLALYYAYASGDTQTAFYYAAVLTAVSFALLLLIQLFSQRGAKSK